ncbi:LytTR family transcriptional regulator DNA-binding domain-containing protein [Pedobacter sp. GR22-6]|uniref:LytTR family transcriptional regulator DNA-binding domain-containing protein n=1 Tax=Pedobacter sp. GR22-6 TaxID=3127957 RepID=UPI003FCEAF19
MSSASTFSRVHRSYLVNKSYVEVIGKTSLRVAGEEIPLGENYRSIFKGSQGHLPGDPLNLI